MTPSKYLIFRLAKAFGYSRAHIRAGDAAAETHLLKEAEAFLGQAVWQNVENIEELSMEYWNLRKLRKERDRVANELDSHQEALSKAHEERANLLGFGNDPFEDLLEERRKMIGKLEELATERDRIVDRAREIRRTFEGLKTKREVLETEGVRVVELDESNERLATMKAEFAELKKARHAVAEKISEGNSRIEEIEREMEQRRQERRVKASEAFQMIGDANQQLSNLHAELGVLETRMHQLYTEIGRHVSRNTRESTECREACKGHKALVDVMRALRQSIGYNNKLAETD